MTFKASKAQKVCGFHPEMVISCESLRIHIDLYSSRFIYIDLYGFYGFLLRIQWENHEIYNQPTLGIPSGVIKLAGIPESNGGVHL